MNIKLFMIYNKNEYAETSHIANNMCKKIKVPILSNTIICKKPLNRLKLFRILNKYDTIVINMCNLTYIEQDTLINRLYKAKHNDKYKNKDVDIFIVCEAVAFIGADSNSYLSPRVLTPKVLTSICSDKKYVYTINPTKIEEKFIPYDRVCKL